MGTIDEIKSRIDIVSLISEYIQLKPAGTNFKALCPFHQEKTPSFFVSPERQTWHCFGCGKGGSIFDFIMEQEGIEFPESLRILAKKAGVVLQREDPQITSQKTKLLDVCFQAAQFFHQILLKSPLGEIARKYLKERGVSSEIIKEFQLGYAPNSWNALSKFLQQKGFKPAEILASGLVVQKQASDIQLPASDVRHPTSDIRFYDRFRNRLMFPLSDVHGNIIGFTGRILDYPISDIRHPISDIQYPTSNIQYLPTSNLQPPTSKYINTPQTLIYNKSQILYGLDKAKQEIRKKRLAVIVEGQMDVLASHQAGIKNVVASSGTALTLDQIKLIKRFTPNLTLAFDIDPAGQEATKRGIEIAWQQDMEVKIISLSNSDEMEYDPKRSEGSFKDPDQLIKKDPKLWQKAIENAQPIMEYYFDSTFKNRDLSKIEEKKVVAKILLSIIAKLKDKIEQDFWLKKLASKLDVQEQALRDSMRIDIRIKHELNVEKPGISLKSRDLMLSERLIGLLLKFPEELGEMIKNLEPKILTSLRLQEIAKNLKSQAPPPTGGFSWHSTRSKTDPRKPIASKIKSFALQSVSIRETSDLKNYLNSLIFSIEKDFPEESSFAEASESKPELEEIQKEAEKIWQELKKRYLLRELKSIERKLKRAEEDKKVDEVRVLSEKFERMTKELGALNRPT